MRKEQIIGNLHHDTLRNGRHQPIQRPRHQQTPITPRQRLPHLRQHNKHRARQARLPPPENIAVRHDEEVGVGLAQDADAGEQVEFCLGDGKGGADEAEHGRDAEGGRDGDEGVGELDGHDEEFPGCGEV